MTTTVKNLCTLAVLLLFAVFLALPQQGFAQRPNSVSQPTPNTVSQPVSGGTSFSVQNPLNANSISEFIAKMLEAVIVIGIPVAVLFMVLAGFRFVLAMGDTKKLQKARDNLLNTVIGIGLFLGAWTIAKIIQATVEALGAGTGL